MCYGTATQRIRGDKIISEIKVLGGWEGGSEMYTLYE